MMGKGEVTETEARSKYERPGKYHRVYLGVVNQGALEAWQDDEEARTGVRPAVNALFVSMFVEMMRRKGYLR